eukprot:567620-Prymnesium_polylepis.1
MPPERRLQPPLVPAALIERAGEPHRRLVAAEAAPLCDGLRALGVARDRAGHVGRARLDPDWPPLGLDIVLQVTQRVVHVVIQACDTPPPPRAAPHSREPHSLCSRAARGFAGSRGLTSGSETTVAGGRGGRGERACGGASLWRACLCRAPVVGRACGRAARGGAGREIPGARAAGAR